ncbi:unnamed protein product [Dimorphilus gyrociliatus]|uniref:CABIT domain-containing protein n=1 Tax=Dimorphilus gyrociliatus TaxID=2664684 RepID=A0A7I8VYU3_9ANNE|nr:unnamed protein product [Dimorphilus gyrociliatus]
MAVEIHFRSDSTLLRNLPASQLPCIGRITRGHYSHIGASKNSERDLYIYNIYEGDAILAEVNRDDVQISIPKAYRGFFEVLNAEGLSTSTTVVGVRQLAKIFPKTALVRQQVCALVYSISQSGQLVLNKQRYLAGGEIIKLMALLKVKAGSTGKNHELIKVQTKNKETLFLSVKDNNGIFSPIAENADEAGVYSISSLIDHYRFPLNVRLVHGVVPSNLESFNGTMTLVRSYKDEEIIACDFNGQALSIPKNEALRLIFSTNIDKPDILFPELANKCKRMFNYFDKSMHFLRHPPEEKSFYKEAEFIDDSLSEHILEEIDELYMHVRTGEPIKKLKKRKQNGHVENNVNKEFPFERPEHEYETLPDPVVINDPEVEKVLGSDLKLSESEECPIINQDTVIEGTIELPRRPSEDYESRNPVQTPAHKDLPELKQTDVVSLRQAIKNRKTGLSSSLLSNEDN